MTWKARMLARIDKALEVLQDPEPADHERQAMEKELAELRASDTHGAEAWVRAAVRVEGDLRLLRLALQALGTSRGDPTKH